MALESASIIKIVCGVGAVGGVGGAGYACKDKIWDFLFNNENYLIVQATEIPSSSPSGDDDNLFDTKTKSKKYKCFLNEKVDDESCEIYKLEISEQNTRKFIDLKTINNSSELVNKKTSDLKQNSYYKLKIDPKKWKNIAYDGTYIIDVEHTTIKENKTYAKLKVIASIDGTKITTNFKQVIAQVKKGTEQTSIEGYKCHIGETELEAACKIYPIHDEEKDFSKISFTSTTKTAATTLKSENWYIIDFSEENKSQTNLTDNNLQKPIKYKKSGSSDVIFENQKLFVGTHDGTATNNKFFVLA